MFSPAKKNYYNNEAASSPRQPFSKRMVMSPAFAFSPLPLHNEKKHRKSSTPSTITSTPSKEEHDIMMYFLDGKSPAPPAKQSSDLFSHYGYEEEEEEEDANDIDASFVLTNRRGQAPKVQWKARQQLRNVASSTKSNRRRKLIADTAAAAQLKPELLEDGFFFWASNDNTFLDVLKRVVAKHTSSSMTTEFNSSLNAFALARKEAIEKCIPDILPEATKIWIDQPINVEKLKSIFESCMRELRSKEESIRSGIVSVNPPTSEEPEAVVEAYEQCSTLKHYFVPNDPRVLDCVFRDLSRVNQARFNSKTFVVDLGNNLSTAFVPFPRASNLSDSAQKVNLLEEITKALDKNGESTDASRKSLIHLLFNDNKYSRVVHETLHSEGINCIQSIDPVTSFAILSDIGLNQSQIVRLRRLLRAHFGSPIFSSYPKMFEKVGDNYIEPETGIYRNGRTRIRYYVKPLDKIVENFAVELHSGDHDFDHIDLSLNVDHGQGYLRASVTLVARTIGDPSNDRKDTFNVASAKCKGDSYEILSNTFAPRLNQSLWLIRNAGYNATIWKDDQRRFSLIFGNTQPPNSVLERNIKLESWINGDLKFFMQATCREGASTYWCFYCKLGHKHWNDEENSGNAEVWTNGRINEHQKTLELKFVSDEERSNIATVMTKCKYKTRLSTDERMGFKPGHRLLFDAVEIDHYVEPKLHFELGLVNMAQKNLLSETQAAYETYSARYFDLEKDLVRAIDAVNEAKRAKNEQESYLNAALKDAQQERKLPLSQRASGMDNEELDEDIKEVEFQLTLLKADIKTAEATRNKLKSAFEEEAKKSENNKECGQPIRDKFEEICSKVNISWAEFHGREMQGPACRRFLEHRVFIIEEFRNYLNSLPPNQKQEHDDEAINMMFDLHLKLFGHLDAYISFLGTKRFALNGEEQQRDAIDHAKKHHNRMCMIWKCLGLSKTPKYHLGHHMIQHFVDTNGTADIAEDEGERAHQVGRRMEERMGRIIVHERKAKAIARAEACDKNAMVKLIKEELLNRTKRNFKFQRKTADDIKAEKHEDRVNKRDELLQEPLLLEAEYKSLQQCKEERYRSQS